MPRSVEDIAAAIRNRQLKAAQADVEKKDAALERGKPASTNQFWNERNAAPAPVRDISPDEYLKSKEPSPKESAQRLLDEAKGKRLAQQRQGVEAQYPSEQAKPKKVVSKRSPKKAQQPVWPVPQGSTHKTPLKSNATPGSKADKAYTGVKEPRIRKSNKTQQPVWPAMGNPRPSKATAAFKPGTAADHAFAGLPKPQPRAPKTRPMGTGKAAILGVGFHAAQGAWHELNKPKGGKRAK